MDKEWFGVPLDLVNQTFYHLNYRDGVTSATTYRLTDGITNERVQQLIKEYFANKGYCLTCYWLGFYHERERMNKCDSV